MIVISYYDVSVGDGKHRIYAKMIDGEWIDVQIRDTHNRTLERHLTPGQYDAAIKALNEAVARGKKPSLRIAKDEGAS